MHPLHQLGLPAERHACVVSTARKFLTNALMHDRGAARGLVLHIDGRRVTLERRADVARFYASTAPDVARRLTRGVHVPSDRILCIASIGGQTRLDDHELAVFGVRAR